MSKTIWPGLRVLAPAASAALLAASLRGAVDPSKMDPKVPPCSDFYLYASGTWLAQNPIPPDRSSWGAGSELQEANYRMLRQILEEAAADRGAPAGSVKAKVGEFFRAGMDEGRIDRDGMKPVQAEWDRIAAVADSEALARELAALHRVGAGAAFAVFVNQDFKNSTEEIGQLYQGGLGLPDRDYYVSDDPHMKEIRTKYAAHVQRMFELAGEPPSAAAAHAKTVLDLETRLARKSMTPVEQRDPKAVYHRISPAELAASAPGFPWNTYLSSVGLGATHDVVVGQPDFFREIGVMAREVPLDDWKVYLRWHALTDAAAYLSSPFVAENFQFYGETLNGQKQIKERWKRVLQSVDTELGEGLGQLYVERAFPPESKAKALAMVKNLQAALGDRLRTIDWIGDATRQQALRKLDAITIKVGYPDRWRDYTALKVDGGSYLANVHQGEEFEFQRNLNKIGKPVDRMEWGITTPTVDAYYNPQLNEIVFPAGILQPPLFDAKADDASNYGAIGAVIGHELTHGFDDQGRQFDADGNLKDWWTESDGKNYEERAKAISKQYSDYVAVDDLHINGDLTLGENIADIGGLKIAYLALQKALAAGPAPGKIDGFNADQRFFISFAQDWRRNTTPEALRVMIATDPHSPAPFRVRGPLADTPAFRKAFGCPEQAGAATAEIW